VLDGAHLVGEAVSAGLNIRHALVSVERLATPEIGELAGALEQRGVDVAAGSASVVAAVSPVRSSSPIVALADTPSKSEKLFESRPLLVVIACDVQDPGNFGAIVRVAEAAGASGAVAAGQSANPFGWKALRGSMGSALRLPLLVEPNVEKAVGTARRRGCRIVAAVPSGGRCLFDVDLTGDAAVLIGSEGTGLSPDHVKLADDRVTIPMTPPVESLNAAVTSALLVYEARRQRMIHGHPVSRSAS